jgi:hypothetical protein
LSWRGDSAVPPDSLPDSLIREKTRIPADRVPPRARRPRQAFCHQ